ncbi:DUF1707 domain-containing protein [Rhodanobacter sp. Root179]|uniref:hypothetical protein n=1 Tax=unclassified Rhodanobacter TaxID=2621553 RepID=UPI0006F9439B|nr:MULTISPECIES: hypothetical protein [unclassified Rhodanobacter]KQZ68462.1 hypothetical protein ASD55_15665 [Rhodanobacter sp. Root561]KRB43154.1 hypothetical protein ASD82_07260 [Rhodanobacter sp. Root179]
MTEREAAINRDLRALDDAHRLGRISRVEYRNRRRRVLQSLSDGGGVVTARKALVPPGSVRASRSGDPAAASVSDSSADAGRALASLVSMRPTLSRKVLLILIAAAVLVVVAGWLMLRH